MLVAFTVSIAAGILCSVGFAAPAASTICFFWILSSSLIALALYQRRVPSGLIDAGVGARIGMLVGIFTAAITGAVTAFFLLLMRWVWHSSGPFDAQIMAAIRQGMGRASESNPDPQVLQSTTALLLSPEGRAGYVLTVGVILAILICVFSIVSGAVGAKMMPARRRPTA